MSNFGISLKAVVHCCEQGCDNKQEFELPGSSVTAYIGDGGRVEISLDGLPEGWVYKYSQPVCPEHRKT